jgi:DNA-binding LacI/PurR family transcriptional regulator/DNA-binding transcriptional regulator YhcF (GntR family)
MRDAKLTDNRLRSQLADQLRERLARGDWPVGTMFPSQRELAREYSVALGTVGHAIRTLVDDGTLDVVKGRGTVVARAVMAGSRKPEAPTAPAIVGLMAVYPKPRITEEERNAGWEATIIRVLEREFSERGGGTRFRNLTPPTQPDAQPVREAAAALRTDGVQAIVLVEVTSSDWVIREIPDLRTALAVPLVCVTWTDLPLNVPHVSYDNRELGHRAATHLLACGYREVLFAAPYSDIWVEGRFAGAQEAVSHAGLPANALSRVVERPVFRMPSPEMAAAEQALAEELVKGLKRRDHAKSPPGVIAINDYQAYRILEVARKAGLQAGRDFGLLGFDDAPQSCELGLTTIRPPLERLGVEAARVVRCALTGESIPLRVSLPGELLARATTSRS